MKKSMLYGLLLPGMIFYASCTSQTTPEGKTLLKDNWEIQSSAEIKTAGDSISVPEYNPQGWYPATMPSTVLAALVKNKVYPDPYYGTNIDSLPGYVPGNMWEMPENSPFNVPWWYRTEFQIPDGYKGKNIWLDFHSINYKANVWLNGHLIADTTTVEGAYRLFDFDITKYAVAGTTNCLALEIFPPQKADLTITWVDWNPTPPDRAMGIWYDVSIHATGPVTIQRPYVITDLNLPSTDTARLTISAELKNAKKNQVTGLLTGEIENMIFSRKVILAPGETKLITFSPDDFPQLSVSNPRLWWPHSVGPQNLYDLNLKFVVNGKVSDTRKQRFGIREITSYMNNFDGKHTRVFQINGKNIVIRGGGYVEDMMLRPSAKSVETAIRYAKFMNLNALRMEAPRGPDYLFDLCDEQGIMLMVGWCCCSTWERWSRWTPHTADIAEESWKDQIIRLRNHPSVFTWLYGSDNFPPADVEKRYISVLDKYDGTRPYESSATQDSSAIAGYTGLWMGPYPDVYAYETPAYWYGKLEFNSEAAPAGEQISPIESLRKMMPEKDLWPISESWNIRLHKRFDPQARKALFSRYGEPTGVEEYCMKSQVFQKEAVRAMFEAFARNKYRSSGIIYWMYNSAWPSLYWQLYDYFLTPNGAFYGTKKACEPLHIQYSYDDRTIYVINGYYKEFNNLKASAQVYNLDMQEKYSDEVPVNIASDESKKIMDIAWPADLSNVYFLKLELKDDSDKMISSNFYWLSAKGDEEADFTGLNKIPEVNLNVSVSSLRKEGDKYILTVDVENPSSSLAFAVNPSIKKDRSGDLVTPVFWEDNYFSLLPKEKRTVKVEFNAEDLDGEKPVLHVGGWNIKEVDKKLNK
ncbi:MAG: hypothetical protein GXO83_11540 [Chlorobi bacterium]|nr:hypothetical protein [Chlorobiota bacterium]